MVSRARRVGGAAERSPRGDGARRRRCPPPPPPRSSLTSSLLPPRRVERRPIIPRVDAAGSHARARGPRGARARRRALSVPRVPREASCETVARLMSIAGSGAPMATTGRARRSGGSRRGEAVSVPRSNATGGVSRPRGRHRRAKPRARVAFGRRSAAEPEVARRRVRPRRDATGAESTKMSWTSDEETTKIATVHRSRARDGRFHRSAR